MNISKGVVLAAGRGTRMKSLTDDRPKPMLPLAGKPMLAHVIERMEDAGVREILVVVGYRADLITDYFAGHPPSRAQLSYRTQEKQDGTGAAARLAREFVGDSPFLLTFGDILVLSSTYQAMFERLPGKDAVVAVKRVDDPYQGAAVYVEGDLVKRMIEKPPKGSSSTPWGNAGIYCFSSGDAVFGELERIPLSPRGEYELTDAVCQMLDNGARLGWYEIEGFWRDVGRPEDLPLAEEHVQGNTQADT